MTSNQKKDSAQQIEDEVSRLRRLQRRRANRESQLRGTIFNRFHRRICKYGYLKHLSFWEVIFGSAATLILWNSRTTSDGTTYIGSADLGIWAAMVFGVAPIFALITWGGGRLFGSKPLDLDE